MPTMNKHLHALCIPLSLLRLRVTNHDKWIPFTNVIHLISISGDYTDIETPLFAISIGQGHRTEASLLTQAGPVNCLLLFTFVLRRDTLLD